jgi:hypothetical protein
LLQAAFSSVTIACLSFFNFQSVGAAGWRLIDYTQIDPSSSQYRAMLPPVVICMVCIVCGMPAVVTFLLVWEHRRQRAGGDSGVVSIRSALVRQLCCMFRPGCQWMAVFILIRRLLLLAVLLLVRNQSVWAWLTFAHHCALVLHLFIAPYKRAVDNRLETVVLFSLGMQTTLLSVWPPPYRDAAIVFWLYALMLRPLIPLLAVLAVNLFQRYCRRADPAAPVTLSDQPGQQEASGQRETDSLAVDREDE